MKTMLGRFAYTAIVRPEGFILGKADYGTRGYTPVYGQTFKTWDAAKKAATDLNDANGVSRLEAEEIVFNTMR